MKREKIDKVQARIANARDPETIARANAKRAAHRARKAHDPVARAIASAIRKSGRLSGIDARRRKVRRWRTLFKHYIQLTGGRHAPLVEQLCSLMVERDQMQHDQLNGKPLKASTFAHLSHNIISLQRSLGVLPDPKAEAALREKEQAAADMREAGLA